MSNLESRLKIRYKNEITKTMTEKFKYGNIYEIPKILKVVVSMGFDNNRDVNKSTDNLRRLTGQLPVITKAKKSIAQFSVRKGNSAGAMVTLRKDKMYHFLDRLLNIAMLENRAFKGFLNKSFNIQKTVNFSFGMKEIRFFPEVRDDFGLKGEGLNVTIVSNCKTKEELKTILMELGFPFQE